MNQIGAIQKLLSRNDTGETGGHQAGILIPKQNEILSFFPSLDNKEKNPRILISFSDVFGDKWTFSFIYYNNKFFNGTRNEYRLTGMTRFLKKHNLKGGDEITLKCDENGFYMIEYRRKTIQQKNKITTLKLSNSWKVINF